MRYIIFFNEQNETTNVRHYGIALDIIAEIAKLDHPNFIRVSEEKLISACGSDNWQEKMTYLDRVDDDIIFNETRYNIAVVNTEYINTKILEWQGVGKTNEEIELLMQKFELDEDGYVFYPEEPVE